MAEQEPRDTSVPDDPTEKEQPEGSREDMNDDVERGVTDRPIEQEQREQQDLPPRGERKDERHA